MKRIKRRVANGNQLPTASKSKSMTFDRTTFLECSKIMKGNITPLFSKEQPSTHEVSIEEKQKATCSNIDMGKNAKLPINNPLSSSPTMKYFVETGTSHRHRHVSEVTNVKKSDGSLSSTKTSSFDFNFENDYESINLSENSTTVNPNEVITQVKNRHGTNCFNESETETSMIQNSPSQLVAMTNPSAVKQRIKRKESRRPVWLKTVQHFVSFMSTISDNVDITSYPTS